ncbi:hypothetical protein OWR29_04085 [Actinoplanes sp. Pm04-4]|uniref:Glycosyl hydrolase family 67 C-terminal domain-containing protein n=1 Tax=Paractinoplanes pyxinae TaxID=2997416 RepID=A0ABT4ASF1_9ACTN|nr:hypothetical protein [Actinoplanes pyxinae]MCY1137166.1 hypothetical protein [Actinoplanes pyxinae]
MRRLLVVIVLLALGAGVAYGLEGALRLSWEPAPTLPPAASVHHRELPLRLTDAGSVGRSDNPAAWGDDYSLNTDIVTSALLPRAPWVDAAAVERIAGEFRQLVDHSAGQGYNGVVVPGFLEYVTFAGHGVYRDDDPHIARARAMVDAFRPVFAYAAGKGMRVYFMTDMLALSKPLDDYLAKRDDPWPIYQAGLRELFASMPFAAGLMVRIGEGGSAYEAPGWDYFSRIAVTEPSQVRAMLRAFLSVAGEADRDIIFRSWTVGVGAVGDLHTNPESYEEVLGGLDDPHLIVSTKFTLGDFYSHLPLNWTLTVGTQRRIVEFQGRREFEGFGALPNDLTALHAYALKQLLAKNEHIEGVWLWTQDGGPLRAGPRTLYLRTGFWQLYDLNAYAMGRLARAPATDPSTITADWVRQTFSADPATVAAIAQVFAMSREAVEKGLYLRPYADYSVKALGLEPPPMMWIFEWDIVTGDSSVLDSIYAIGRDHVDETIADGRRAATIAGDQLARINSTDPAKWRDPALRTRLIETLEYQQDLFGTLAAYRELVLRRAQWVDTGSATARKQWRSAQAAYEAARDNHVRRYGTNVDLPAYNFTAADLGNARFARDPAMAIAARVLLALLALSLLWPAARRLWLAGVMPWRAQASSAAALLFAAAVLVVSRAIFTWFAAPAHMLVTLAAWAVVALVARLLVRNPYLLWTVIAGVALLRSVLLLGVLAVRGPGYYWFGFWTNPAARSAYVIVGFALFAWLFVALGSALRHQYGWPRRRVTGAVLLTAGLPTLALGLLVWVVSLETALTTWNDQLALLPWGLHRILGMVTYLGIPPHLPIWLTAFGAIAAATGAALRRLPTPASPTQPQ